MSSLTLQFGFSFQDLHTVVGLEKIDAHFRLYLKESDAGLFQTYEKARLEKVEASELLLQVAPILEDFLAELFDIESVVQDLQKQHHELSPLYTCKRTFIQRQVARKGAAELAASLDGARLRQQLETLFKEPFSDLVYATHVLDWLRASDKFEESLEVAKQYGIWALFSKAGQTFHKKSPLFQPPQKQDYAQLIPDDSETHQREGFALTDTGLSRAQALDQANYCIFCH